MGKEIQERAGQKSAMTGEAEGEGVGGDIKSPKSEQERGF